MSRNISSCSILSVSIRRWRHYRAWSPAERRLFRRCLSRLLAVRLRLYRHGFVATQAYYRDLSDRSDDRPAHNAVLVDRMVRRVAWLLPGSTCLMRALSVWSLLREQGVVSELRIGVNRGVNRRDSDLNAHAWVEVDGHALGEGRAIADYAVFPTADTGFHGPQRPRRHRPLAMRQG